MVGGRGKGVSGWSGRVVVAVESGKWWHHRSPSSIAPCPAANVLCNPFSVSVFRQTIALCLVAFGFVCFFCFIVVGVSSKRQSTQVLQNGTRRRRKHLLLYLLLVPDVVHLVRR